MHPLARDDEFTLSHNGNSVQLRPSLRAAMRLERLHDGFGPLITKLDQFNTATIRDMILIAATDYSAAQRFLAAISTEPLQTYSRTVTGPLESLLTAFLPAPSPDTPSTSTTPEKAVPWSEAYAQLYQIGTGWLGWTPSETWAATPTEITQALEGRVAHLIAMNGGSGNTEVTSASAAQREENIAAGLDPDFDRAGLQALKAKL
jgi:hypothetical protein